MIPVNHMLTDNIEDVKSAIKILRDNNFNFFLQDFRQFLLNTEKRAKEYSEISKLSKQELKSVVYKEAWSSSKLRRDLKRMTIHGSTWDLFRPVLHKILHPNASKYKTENLIDTFLLQKYLRNKTEIKKDNPLDVFDNNVLSEKKIRFIKSLYSLSRDLNKHKNILASEDFQKYKTNFDIEAMGQVIERIEKHYKNTFFKIFWNDERRTRFSDALKNKWNIINEIQEINDDVLNIAMNYI